MPLDATLDFGTIRRLTRPIISCFHRHVRVPGLKYPFRLRAFRADWTIGAHTIVRRLLLCLERPSPNREPQLPTSLLP